MAFGRGGKGSADQAGSSDSKQEAAPKAKIPAARPSDWPAVNTEVVIVFPKDGGIFRTRVHEHDRVNGQFILSLPEEGDDTIDAKPGDKMMTTWTSPAGLHELKTELVASLADVQEWKVEPTSPVIVHERRRFPRIRRTGAIHMETGSRALTATMLDLSEGGARCVIDTTQNFTPDLVSTTLNLDNRAVKIKGWVAWKKQHGKHTEVGISFAGVSKRDADMIRRYVMGVQSFQSRKI